jgi:hypothetical protein
MKYRYRDKNNELQNYMNLGVFLLREDLQLHDVTAQKVEFLVAS